MTLEKSKSAFKAAPWLVSLSSILLVLLGARALIGWRESLARQAELQRKQVAQTVALGYFDPQEAETFHEAIRDRNSKTNPYDDASLERLLSVGRITRGTESQARDRRAEVKGMLTYFVRRMTPSQKAKVADYARFQMSQDDHGVGGAYDVTCALDLLTEARDPRFSNLVRPYLGDPRASVRNAAMKAQIALAVRGGK